MKKVIILALMFSGCAGLKIKDMNKIDQGMSKSKVLDILGDPNSKRMVCGKEVYEYEMKDEDGETRPRVVVFEDREVSFYGKPSEIKCSTSENDRATNQNTNTVSPTINVNPNIAFNPIITVNGSSGSPSPLKAPAGSGSYFHEIPTAEERK